MFPEFKSLKDNEWNLAILSGRQHKIAHRMLWKAYGGSQTRAFYRMCSNKDRGSKSYAEFRKEHSKIVSESQRGDKNHMFGKTGEMCHNYGRKHSEESRKRMSESKKGEKSHLFGKTGELALNYGRKHSDEARTNMSLSKVGKHLSEEHKEKMRTSTLGLMTAFHLTNKMFVRITKEEFNINKGILYVGAKSKLAKQ